ncbi:HAD family hydrolase [Paenibacillus agricola]|uniref:HAD family hydrolase n=1 Tax=Paenibacillus agricola TaxID=2716264 RepID=A0ABX0J145_9BACL|nr:HAD family hydrolase [Paenibacillus agricola]NHN29975.1 HAD family hydrolase [Paenibacillus agricola]
MTIEAVVFDFDGLIVDTESAWYEALAEIFQEHGAVLPLEMWSRCVGASHDVFNPYDYLEQVLQKPIDLVAIKALTESKHSLIMQERTVRPGVEAYLQSAMEQGLKIGLASSSTRSWVEGYLQRFGLLHYFSCIRTADDVAKVKPDPELYLQAVAGLGVSPSKAVAFEDSPNGARAAMAAGLYCVIVPNSITATFSFDGYHMRMNSMADMELTEVVSALLAHQ